jgi:hypothetical protein
MEQLDLGGDLSYNNRPIRILDTTERVSCTKVIKVCKVQCDHHTEDEATWEHEEELQADYPELFPSTSESRGQDSFGGGRGRSVTHTFCMIKFCQARSALGCIFGKI